MGFGPCIPAPLAVLWVVNLITSDGDEMQILTVNLCQ